MHIEQKVKIHNRFDVHIDNIETGEHRELVGYNIILDQMWTRLCGGSSYFANIHFGTGTGTPKPERTSLFSHLGTKSAVTEETIKALPVSSWKRKVVLNPEEYVGQTITEVGIAFGSTDSNLVTHAMLKDSEGNEISITKSDTDVVTIFATVFITFANNIPEVTLLGMPNNNQLINYLVGGSAPTGSFGLNIWHNAYARLGSTASATWTSDVPNKKRKTNVLRFGTTVGNGHVRNLDFTNLFGLNLPASGIFTGQPYTNVNVGVGDGVNSIFELPSRNIRESTLAVKVNGVLTSSYTLNTFPNAADLVQPPSVPSQGYSVSLSADGLVLAMGSGTSPYLGVWDWTGTEWVLRAQPPSVPGSGYSVALSADGSVLAMGSGGTSPYVSVWDWTGTEWVLRAQPPSVPGSGNSVSLSADGSVLAMGSGGTSPYVSVWDWTGTEWVLRAQPPSVPGRGASVALSADGSVLAMGSYNISPYLGVWDWTGTEWVLRAQPPSVPAYGTSVSLSADGSVLAMGSGGTSPYLGVWDWTGTEWVLRAQPPSVPSQGYSVSLSADGNTLAMGSYNISPYLGVWDWTGTEWVLRAQPPSVPSQGYSVSLSADGNTLAMGSYNISPYLRVWSFDVPLTSHSITFDTPPALDDVITADYTVDGVHKTDQYVIDASFAIQFGEGV